MAVALGFMAQGQAINPRALWMEGGKIESPKAQAKAAQPKAESSMWFGYCGDPYTLVGAGSYYCTAAMEIPASTAAGFAGCKIDGFRMVFKTASVSSATLFVGNSLDTAPSNTQTISVALNSTNWQEFTLSNPVTLDGSTVYIGFGYQGVSGEYPIVFDGLTNSNNLGAWLGLGSSFADCFGSFDSYTASYGNVCIQAHITGDFPEVNTYISAVTVDRNRVKPNTAFDATVTIANMGTTDVTSVTVDYTIGNIADTYTFNTPSLAPLKFTESTFFTLSGLTVPDFGEYPLTVKLTKVNGADCDESTATVSIVGTRSNNPRMMVVEEATSIGCGYCPVGIIGLEYMKEHYGDQFIGIGVHGIGLGYDPMVSASYQVMDYYVSSYPSCLTNRNDSYATYPSADYLLDSYTTYFKDAYAAADVTIDAEWTTQEKSGVKVTTNAVFDLDHASSDYRWAYVVIENQVGPYKQSNYYNGESGYGDWSSAGSSVSWLFDEVGRSINSFWGVQGSVPSAITAGNSYENSGELQVLDLINYYDEYVEVNPENIEVIGMLIDYTTGEVVTAARIDAADIKACSDPNAMHYQKIIFDPDLEGNVTIGSSLTIEATSTSGLPVTIGISSGDEYATLEGNVITFNAAGTVVVTLSQDGNDTYMPATSRTITFKVLKDQTITWDQDLSNCEIGKSYALTAKSSANLTITYSIKEDTTVAKIQKTSRGTSLVFNEAGTVTVVATQEGNSTYAPAQMEKVASTQSGVISIDADELQDAMLYNLQGVRVNNPQAGRIYIMVTGSSAQKVLII